MTISLLVNTLGPILIPLASAAFTWLFHKIVGALSPGTQAVINPLLPLVAGAIGSSLGIASGQGAGTGFVAGLAGTGLHQLITQPVKAARASAPTK